MANPFSKGWKYMMSSFDKKIDDNADPKVQIPQAAEAAREQHRQIQEQAAAVIGNRNQLEMSLSRLQKERDKLTANTRAAVQQADAARAAAEEAGESALEQRPYLHIEANPDRVKQHVVHEALKTRKSLSGLFIDGTHQAVSAEGPSDRYLIGLARGFADSPSTDGLAVIALATRRPLKLAGRGGWLDTTLTLPEGTWTDRLTGQSFEGTVPVAEVFNLFPTALLVSDRIEASYV